MKCEKSIDADGFTVVTHKQKRKYKNKKHNHNPLSPTPAIEEVYAFKRSKIDSIQVELKCSEFFESFKESFNCALIDRNLQLASDQQREILNTLTEKNVDSATNNSDEIDIVCYGLGHFTSCMIARYQLAFLMILKEEYHPSTVSLYDPVFLAEEKFFLKELGLEVLDVDESAKRTISRKTIFFMPHCDLFLYDNLLCANWKKDCLQKLIIIGNSFQNYFSNEPERILKQTGRYVYFANDIVTEVKICNNFQFTDIFNNLSVHYFKLEDLSKFQKWDISEVNVESI